MAIQILTPAPDKLLTSLAKVKLTLGISDSDTTRDEILEDLIASSSQFVMTYTGRDFAQQTVKESIVGKGLPDILVSLTPIVEVEMIEFDDTLIDPSEYTVTDKEAGIIQRPLGFRSTEIRWNTINQFPSPYGEERYHVTYTGGYVLPGWGSSSGSSDEPTLPKDLERAVIDMVKSQFKNLKYDGTMKTYKIGDTAITWDTSSGASGDAGVSGFVPRSALPVLNYYRRAF